jgi:hypothetical protein
MSYKIRILQRILKTSPSIPLQLQVQQVYVQISEEYRTFMIQRPGEVGNEPGSDDADQPAT